MTKGLTGLTFFKSSMVAPYKEDKMVVGEFIVLRSPVERTRNKHWRRIFPFLVSFWMTPLPVVISSRILLPVLHPMVPKYHCSNTSCSDLDIQIVSFQGAWGRDLLCNLLEIILYGYKIPYLENYKHFDARKSVWGNIYSGAFICTILTLNFHHNITEF